MAQTALRRGTQEEGNSDYFTGCPIGGGFIWYGLPDKIPSNCRICDNSTLAISQFTKLYENLDGAWGQSNGNMNLPDLRGRFPRGVDGSANRDTDKATRTASNTGGRTGNAVGSVQNDELKSHAHTYIGHATQNGDDNGSAQLQGTQSRTTDASGGSETRPKNANVYFVIRIE